MIDERDIQEIISSNIRSIPKEILCPKLVKILSENFTFKKDRLYVLLEIPDQSEDVYLLCMDGSRIVRVEIDRITSAYSLKEDTVEEFLKNKHGKKLRKKIAAAHFTSV